MTVIQTPRDMKRTQGNNPVTDSNPVPPTIFLLLSDCRSKGQFEEPQFYVQ